MSSEPPLPASPCRRQCCLDYDDICLGCGRSMQEILDWSAADAQRRRQICQTAEARLRERKAPG
ncbi:conserved hypothetical protein [Pseudomonas sp. 8Z]|uniref:DUF1289 domain-containing protein n=1 Tax=Pseudomonas sp. 8Z TaxID=2653166 RepID=UPI0012EFBF67|nr:DUF1289 domain-containing protein [Pseudomonas sp. 8Z]VXC85154.1 conserved hypothetical protein [Pseudomonas sp. 8Z]